ncbi:MAG: TIGR02450 family Trp-rich protein [Betaproteobacteria bacterium]|nr:TIGR02450 family Trp-rich protein [Betaproteobacteria bacterium]MDE2423405.1 TIGR02450 family Trp-rich protein [Betaproteobacteria bacterium]
MDNPVNSKKLLLSKWTSLTPQNKEKHHMVVKVTYDDNNPQLLQSVTMEAVYNQRQWTMDWQELKNSNLWRPGWK